MDRFWDHILNRKGLLRLINEVDDDDEDESKIDAALKAKIALEAVR